MKLLLVTLLVVSAYAEYTEDTASTLTAFGYLTRYGVPRLEAIKAAEEAYNNNPESRIVGGAASSPGQFPYQAGLLIDLIGFTGQAVCGAVLVNNQRLLTAAHCWSDGQHQAWRFTVVLGTVQLFTGGTRLQTSVVVTHPSWLPALIRNDIAVIYLPTAVATSATIAPIALPSGSQLSETFAGEIAIASGFGLTSDGGSLTTNQYLSHVTLNVITNSACSIGFPFVIQESNICTSGFGGVGTCSGDSGGPLAVYRDGRPILVGITSFGIAFGCQLIFPSAFARVTSFTDFINTHL
ncbi:brachyurin-like [Cydia pomonella]|uniref:brachyurin-like n=1 Tax=Cydia pomonella TaxID=82600 RepID=UPI002ADDAA4B|nr:brachyurin-like [Cydia pomonella]